MNETGNQRSNEDIRRQANFIRSWNLVPEADMSSAESEAQTTGRDLCEILLESGHLVAESADQLREAIRRGIEKQNDFGFGNTVELSGEITSADFDLSMSDVEYDESRKVDMDAEENVAEGIVAKPFQSVDRYQIIKRLGRGGVGSIFLAEHQALKKKVALKVMRRKDAGPKTLSRFKREARSLARLEHPNIVRVMDYGHDRDDPYIVMELIEGENLKVLLNNWRDSESKMPPWRWTVQMLGPIVKALSACHDAGIVHRDIKMHNIVIEAKTQRPVLVDFGLVKQHEPDDEVDSSIFATQLTGANSLVGTPAYMSPEQINPQEFGTIGPHTDVWGIGGTLYACLTGKEPFGLHGKIMEICMRIIKESPTPVLDQHPRVPLVLSELCHQCLSRNPSDRPTMQVVNKVFDTLGEGQMRTR
jgi:serine/threonine protein kinase